MKKAMFGMLVAVMAVVLVSTEALAKGDKKPKDNSSSVCGTLTVERNDKGEVTGAVITTKSSTAYHVVMTGLTQDVSTLDGKEVRAKGDVKDDNGKMMLSVKGEIAGPGEKKAGAKKGGDKKAKGKKADAAPVAPAEGK